MFNVWDTLGSDKQGNVKIYEVSNTCKVLIAFLLFIVTNKSYESIFITQLRKVWMQFLRMYAHRKFENVSEHWINDSFQRF